MTNYFDNLIGHTPLVRLEEIEKEFSLKVKLFAKLESVNLTGSVKDRPALEIVLSAIREGKLSYDKPLIEATSGNMGISFSAICQKLGYKSIIVMPENMSNERKTIIKSYGATLVETKKELGMAGAVEEAEKIAKTTGGFLARQFENYNGVLAHYKTTAPEIFNELNGKVDVFVAGIGSGGTITGSAKYFKEQNKNVKIVGVEPKSSPLLTEGKFGSHAIQGVGANFIPKILDLSLIDSVVAVNDEDAFKFSKKLALSQALLCGISSGAALFGAVKFALDNNLENKNVVLVLPDSGLKYLSTNLFN